MRYVNTSSADTVTFLPTRFNPLSCEDFVIAHNDKTKLYTMIADAEKIEICDLTGKVRFEERGQVRMPIDFKRSLPVYALVEGGWLPPPLTAESFYLFDRNVIGNIQQILKGNSREIYADTDWWLKMVADDRMHINPLLYAFESNGQKIPDLAEFRRSYAEAVVIIRELFPRAAITQYGDEHFAAAFETMQDVLKHHSQETEFLQRVVPLIREKKSEQQLADTGEEILTTAADLGLTYQSLPLLAALSCLYEDDRVSGFNAARAIIKPGGGEYTAEKAYNALSDMRGLLFYLAFRAISNNMKKPTFTYCTADKAALLFGCGLNFANVEFRGNELNVKLDLTEFLFPRLSFDKRQELARRIENG